MAVEITVHCGMVTSKSVAWGGKAPERFTASQEGIRCAVQKSPGRTQLKKWLESRTRLSLTVEFHLNKRRVHHCDIDSLLSDLFNPLVEAACGPREHGKPIPQTKDALFWRVMATKVAADEERIVMSIEPLGN